MKYIIASLLILSVFGLMVPNAFAVVPDWVKNTAGWWATDAISETEFVNAIEFLVKENIIQVNVSQTSETSQGVPEWVKNTAGWWATDVISETEFVNAIAYLIKVGIISIESTKSPESIAEMWVNGHISDDEFLASVERMIENDIITIQSESITKTSDLPDWLVNNAGWWAARIFTNSDFSFDPGYVKERIFPCEDDSRSGIIFNLPGVACIDATYNSHGFRGNEFQEQKHEIDFRIFAVGGSTTQGQGAEDDETWPVHLQQIINEKITGKKIEVINAGSSGADTITEYGLIKNKLSSLDPDLIIIYDGWNDAMGRSWAVKETIQNWDLVCKLGKNEGFDTIIIVQPLPITGQRVLTEHEIIMGFGYPNLPYLQKSQQYVDAFAELDKVCTKAADFRRIFDYVQEPVFIDHGHTMSFGNKIIAENVFSVISPIYFGQTYSVTHSDLQIGKKESGTGVVYAVGSDLSNRNFDNLNLQNAVFDKADLSNTSFKNANIDGARFMFANLDNSNLLDRTDLSNINLAGTDLSNISLTGKDLSGTMLTAADLSGAILTGADLSGAILTGADLSGKDFTGAILTGVDLSNMDLTEVIFIGVDLSGLDLNSSKLAGVDLSGKNLTRVMFDHASFADADLENVNLTKASVVQVDFTKIKNKSLAGADLTDASLAYSNLSGVNLAGVILHTTNFWKANLSGVDFTAVSNASIEGSAFIETNLSDSNFQGVDLSSEGIFAATFKNKAHLRNLSAMDIIETLFDKSTNKLLISGEVRGNDLVISYVIFNNFAQANLENANFKNADLRHVGFHSANLTNADLSGVDLSNADLSGVDLSNADLKGANLQGAILDNAILSNANLKCINHTICLDE